MTDFLEVLSLMKADTAAGNAVSCPCREPRFSFHMDNKCKFGILMHQLILTDLIVYIPPELSKGIMGVGGSRAGLFVCGPRVTIDQSIPMPKLDVTDPIPKLGMKCPEAGVTQFPCTVDFFFFSFFFFLSFSWHDP